VNHDAVGLSIASLAVCCNARVAIVGAALRALSNLPRSSIRNTDAMAPPRFLDQDLLDQFDAQLRRLGAPLADNWAPLSDEEIDAILTPLGIDLPEEARRWWRWHNGALNDDQIGPHYLLGERPVYSLQRAADNWAELGELLLEGWQWPSHFAVLQVAGTKPWLFVFCGRARDAPVPVYVQEDIGTPEELLPSIGELVVIWTTMLASGSVSIEPDGLWNVREQQWPYLL
jgi:SMI1/KNR4 family protein SUKH-1